MPRSTDPTRQYSLHWDGLSTDLRETVVAGAIGDGMTYQGLPVPHDARRRHRFHPSAKAAALAVFLNAQRARPLSRRWGAGRQGKGTVSSPCAIVMSRAGHGFVALFRPPRSGLIAIASTCGPRPRRIATRITARADYDWGFREFHKTNGYLANELTGLWLRGPICTTDPSRRCAICSPAGRAAGPEFYRGYDLIDAVAVGTSARRALLGERFGKPYETKLARQRQRRPPLRHRLVRCGQTTAAGLSEDVCDPAGQRDHP